MLELGLKDRVAAWHAQAEEDGPVDCVPVDGQCDGLPYPHVRHRALAVVEDYRHVRSGNAVPLLQQLDALGRGDAGNLLQRHVYRKVDLAGPYRGHAGLRVLYRDDDDPLGPDVQDIRVKVAVVLLQHQPVARHLLHEPVGTGPDGVRVLLMGAALVHDGQ